ncbi:alanine racemase [Levilactobacillus tangyuanensis]|uniref:Alanine racemase n=1 Tax=Levilactobacillus tangyuanensis TaxID=2486021 RepID=A0ABW1TPR9_9LACO|nr:alanine racemase [Levilactobacillus tangyuanensis]
MIIGEHRPSKLVIDREAIRHNIREEVQRLPKDCELFMVVKANGYGHGAVQVAAAAKEAGAKGFCVAILDEALELRAAGFDEPILVLGVVEPEYAPLMAREKVSTTVAAEDWLAEADHYLKLSQPKEPLRVHLGLDTGMGRIGFQTPAALQHAVAFLAEHDTVFTFEGMFTHFSTADEASADYFHKQVERWDAFMAAVPDKPRYVHVTNSATSLWHADHNINIVRYGAAGYGLNPSGNTLKPPFELQPAMSLVSELAHCKQLAAGESVSYGATYTTTKAEWVGTVSLGYADGYERRLQGFHVLVDGQPCEIIGRICMDQFMIRLPHQYPRGTKVTLVGRNGGAEITLQEMAEYCGTINYEIACGFTARVPRRYTH